MSPDEAQQLLGVSPNASQRDVEVAFRKQATRYHPDSGGDQATFKKFEKAKATLLSGNRQGWVSQEDAEGKQKILRTLSGLQPKNAAIVVAMILQMATQRDSEFVVRQAKSLLDRGMPVEQMVDGMLKAIPARDKVGTAQMLLRQISAQPQTLHQYATAIR